MALVVAVPVNDNQFGALLSFTFNLGIGSLRSSTLLKKLNAGDYAGAANAFQRHRPVAEIPLVQPDPALCPSNATPPALSLRLNGLDTGLQAVGCDATPDQPSVTFRLSPDTAGGNASIDAAWQAILHNPWQTDRGHFVRSFELKLLKADGTPVQKSQTLLSPCHPGPAVCRPEPDRRRLADPLPGRPPHQPAAR